jgi:hypothetical protein
MQGQQTLQLGELCRRLGVPARRARYVLEQKILPDGVDPDPDRGNHRQLTLGQAYWLGIVLKLKEAGMSAPRAACAANAMEGAFTALGGKLMQDPHFNPFYGLLNTTCHWFVEIGDSKYVRLSFMSDPPTERPLMSWVLVDENKIDLFARPVVRIRVYLSGLAALLGGHAPRIEERPAEV